MLKDRMAVLGILLCVCSLVLGFAPAFPDFDVVIINGTIVDGTENPWFRGDIGITGDRIVKIGRISKNSGKTIIDARGKIVAPGFIDIHSHGERQILTDRTAHNLITQGATTIIGGNCGGSPLDLDKFFTQFESKGAALNVGVLIGHNTIRRKVMGNAGRAPTEEELEAMKKYVDKAMRAGALGFSTGLKYRPGVYTQTDEVIALARVASNYGGFYATHLRDEGLRLFESMEEAFRIGREANISVQLSHHKAAGADMWGQSTKSLHMMENARQGGLDVTTDQHPYPATFTTCTIIFPPWALEGSRSDIKNRLKDPNQRKKVMEGIVENIIHDRGGNDIQNITIAVFPEDTRLEGKDLKEILTLQGKDPTMINAAELLIELYERGGASCVFHCLSMEDVIRIMQHPLTMHGSDAGNSILNKGKVHPRHYGHFPRIIARHVRDRGDLSLEQAIRKMTSMPAARIGCRNRGILSEGKYADIVIFDLNKIQDKATFTDPHQYPEGIDYVLVNGETVVDHGQITGKLPGRILYGPGKK
ncbi:MAG: D-aminoacylase [Candidatus Aminicenantes bacterium]